MLVLRTTSQQASLEYVVMQQLRTHPTSSIVADTVAMLVTLAIETACLSLPKSNVYADNDVHIEISTALLQACIASSAERSSTEQKRHNRVENVRVRVKELCTRYGIATATEPAVLRMAYTFMEERYAFRTDTDKVRFWTCGMTKLEIVGAPKTFRAHCIKQQQNTTRPLALDVIHAQLKTYLGNAETSPITDLQAATMLQQLSDLVTQASITYNMEDGRMYSVPATARGNQDPRVFIFFRDWFVVAHAFCIHATKHVQPSRHNLLMLLPFNKETLVDATARFCRSILSGSLQKWQQTTTTQERVVNTTGLTARLCTELQLTDDLSHAVMRKSLALVSHQ